MIETRGQPDPEFVPPSSYFRATVDPDSGGGLPDTNNNTAGITSYGRPLAPLLKGEEGQMYTYLFAGYQSVDWHDPLTAKVDTKRFMLLHDSTKFFRSGNDAGIFNTRRFWLPFNRMFRYDDKEFGGRDVGGVYAADTRSGMGNIFIMDIFEAIPNSEDQIALTSESTLYWHEK